MMNAVSEGVTPTEKAYGMPLFEHLGSDEESSTLFNQAMAGHSEIIIKKLLEVYRGFEGVDVLVDVGGGTGSTLRMVTAQHPHVRGVNYDLPRVIAQAPPVQGPLHYTALAAGSGQRLHKILSDDQSLLVYICRCGTCRWQHV